MGKPVYLYECIVCEKRMYTTSMIERHCDRLTQWIDGIEGKGIDMEETRYRVKVEGYMVLRESDLNRALESDDPHMALVYALPMGYCDASGLEFDVIGEEEEKEETKPKGKR